MRTFECACGARIFFENSICVNCGLALGFAPELGVMTALTPTPDGGLLAHANGSPHRRCTNYVEQGICNWLLPGAGGPELCQACALTRTVPDLSQSDNQSLWADMERAKRRLLYSLQRLGLPTLSRAESPNGLAFDIKADTPNEHVLTGHADGLITLNLAEADPVLREKMRVAMEERYRTPLGHFRHESGHYYWDLLVRDTEFLQPCRALFGDDQLDYGAALRAHYDNDEADWQQEFISSYASAHPWEDWAETWAHYLHIVDTLETAQDFGLVGWSPLSPGFEEVSAEAITREWGTLTVALNALNRSMGMPDAYPFLPSDRVNEKIAFVHRVVSESATRGS